MTITSSQQIVFPIQFFIRAILKPDGKYMALNSWLPNDFLFKKLKQEQKVFNTFLISLLWKKVLFLPRNAGFCPKMLPSAKFRESCHCKKYFLKLYICVRKYQISSFYHDSSKVWTVGRGFGFSVSSPRHNEPEKCPPRWELNDVKSTMTNLC